MTFSRFPVGALLCVWHGWAGFEAKSAEIAGVKELAQDGRSIERAAGSFAKLLFCLAACIPALCAPIQDVPKPHADRIDRAWKRYRNAELGYCVSYPSRWSKGEAFDGTGILVKTRESAKPVGEIDVGPISSPAPEDARLQPARLNSGTLDQDFEDHLAGLRRFVRAEKIEVISQQHLKVQGFDALYVKDRYYDPLERSSWMEEVVFVERHGELYRLELQCPPNQIARFEQVFAYLVNSLEFECK